MIRSRAALTVMVTIVTGLLSSGCAGRTPNPSTVKVAGTAVEELAKSLGFASREVSLPETQIAALARDAKVGAGVVTSTAQGAGSNRTWKRISSSIARLNDATSGPERRAVVATACDYFKNGYVTEDDLIKNLVDAGFSVNPSVAGRMLVDDANELIEDLTKALRSTDPYERAAVPVLCFTVGQLP